MPWGLGCPVYPIRRPTDVSQEPASPSLTPLSGDLYSRVGLPTPPLPTSQSFPQENASHLSTSGGLSERVPHPDMLGSTADAIRTRSLLLGRQTCCQLTPLRLERPRSTRRRPVLRLAPRGLLKRPAPGQHRVRLVPGETELPHAGPHLLPLVTGVAHCSPQYPSPGVPEGPGFSPFGSLPCCFLSCGGGCSSSPSAKVSPLLLIEPPARPGRSFPG